MGVTFDESSMQWVGECTTAVKGEVKNRVRWFDTCEQAERYSRPLTPLQAKLLVAAEQHMIPTEGMTRCECGAKYWDGNVCASCGATYKPHDLLVSGVEYRTAISLEKRGHMFVRYQGPALGWVRLRA